MPPAIPRNSTIVCPGRGESPGGSGGAAVDGEALIVGYFFNCCEKKATVPSKVRISSAPPQP